MSGSGAGRLPSKAQPRALLRDFFSANERKPPILPHWVLAPGGPSDAATRVSKLPTQCVAVTQNGFATLAPILGQWNRPPIRQVR
jgi:hypothetical protein